MIRCATKASWTTPRAQPRRKSGELKDKAEQAIDTAKESSRAIGDRRSHNGRAARRGESPWRPARPVIRFRTAAPVVRHCRAAERPARLPTLTRSSSLSPRRVPVGVEVADALGAPLDVIIVRKLGTPGQPELAMGAIGAGGARILNYEVLDALRITDGELEAVARRGSTSSIDGHSGCAAVVRAAPDRAHRDPGGRRARHREHRAGRDPRAHREGARRVVVATPVAPRSTVIELGGTSPTRWCPRRPRSRSVPSASGTSTSGRRATTRSSRCSTADSGPRAVPLGPPRSRRHPGPPLVGGSLTAATPATVATVAATDARSASRS